MAAGNLEGKVIAITGGASGMGLATAKLLSSRGAILALADLNQAGLDEIATTIRSQGGKVVTRVTDVRNPDQVNAFIDTAVAEYGKLDGAVNMAGILGKNAYKHSVEELSLEEWELIMGVNATGTFNSLKKELQVIVDGGSIVNVGSILSIRGSANNPAYAASKHAVLGLSRSAAKSAGSRGVRVNVIAPGTTNTPMVHVLENQNLGSARSLPTPLGRKGEPEEIAAFVAFLLGDESRFITGAVYPIDGGWSA